MIFKKQVSINLRLPTDLHEKIKAAAADLSKKLGVSVSINQFLLRAARAEIEKIKPE